MEKERWDHQKEVVTLNRPKLLLVWSGGTGKTLGASDLAELHEGVPFVVCIKKKKVDWKRDMPHADVLTKEDVKLHPELLPKNPSCIILDEVHTMIGGEKKWSKVRQEHYNTSMQYQALLDYVRLHPDTPIYALSATPYRSVWANVFCYYELFGYDVNYMEWKKRFTRTIKMGTVFKAVQRQDAATTELLQKLLDDLSHKVVKENPLNKSVPVEVPITLEFPEDVKSFHDFYKQENKHPNMLTMLDAYVQKGTVIVCYYVEEVMMLKERYNCRAIAGAFEYEESMQHDDILVVQFDSATGYELPYHHTMVFFSYGSSHVNHQQARWRIDRSNYPKPNTYVYMRAHYTDSKHLTQSHRMILCLKKKQKFEPKNWSYDA